MSARPTRADTGVAPTSAQIIASGPDTTPMNLPESGRPTRGGITGAQPVTNTLIADPEDFDGDNPDTNGFLFNDENIFESGGLNKSDPLFLKRYKAAFPKKKFVSLAEMVYPGYVVKDKGKDWEFLGYLGEDLPLDDQENESFEAYEKSEFGGLLKNLINTKSPNLKSAAQIIQHQSPKKLGLFRRFINPDHLYQSFDGYEPVEYAISDDPEMSDFFLFKAIKAVGKGIGKAAKAVGKGVKNATRAVGKGIKNATKFAGRTADKLTNWAAEKVNLAIAGKPQQMDASNGGGYVEPDYSQLQQPYTPDYGNSLVDSGAYQDGNGNLVYAQPQTALGAPNGGNNKNTYLIIAVIAAVVILGGLFIYKSK